MDLPEGASINKKEFKEGLPAMVLNIATSLIADIVDWLIG